MEQSTTPIGSLNVLDRAWVQLIEGLGHGVSLQGEVLEVGAVDTFSMFARPLLWRTLRSDDGLPASDVPVDAEELAGRWRVMPRRRRLFDAVLAILVDLDVLRVGAAGFIPPSEDLRVDLEEGVRRLPAEKQRFLETHPDLEAYVRLFETCSAHLLEVLRGTIDGTDVLFPGGSLDLVEGIYRGNRVSDYFNSLLARGIGDAVKTAVAERNDRGKAVVLELGAGTGGSSAFVLNALRPYSDRVTYWYTDVSNKFLHHARRTFVPDFPFVIPARLDLERDPSGALPLGRCDVVFATNVLHATTNIRRTLRHVARLMSDGGLLLINEPTSIQHYGTLTFGLLDGWWLYEDVDRRITHSPLLSVDAWAHELEYCGFRGFRCFGGAGEASPQHVLAAQFRSGGDRGSQEAVSGKRIGPFVPMNAQLLRKQRAGADVSQRKRAYLKAFGDRFSRGHATSKLRAQEYRRCYADQRAIAFFHPTLKELCFPLELERSRGARVWDVDGNEYIDIAMDFGCNLFGHRPGFMVDVLKRRVAGGLALGMRPPSSARAARLLCALTGHERAMFTQSGTEAVMTAIRLARHATGRREIVIFSNSYHGHSDGVLAYASQEEDRWVTRPIVAANPPGMVRDVVVLEYNVPRSLDWLRSHGERLAAVVVEPMQSRRLNQWPGGFLRELRRVTEAAGAALIFDEMITGFRAHPGGAQAWFGVRADLCTYGKVLGGGVGQGAVAGRARLLDGVDGGFWSYGDDSYPSRERTFSGGTHSQNTLGMASVEAVLQRVTDAGPRLQEALNQLTADFSRIVNDFFQAEEVPLMVQYFASQFRFEPNGVLSPIDQNLFVYALRDRGIMISEIGNNFFCTAHEREHVERIVDAIRGAVSDLREGGYLGRRPPSKIPPLPEPPYGNRPRSDVRSPRFEALLAGIELA